MVEIRAAALYTLREWWLCDWMRYVRGNGVHATSYV